MSFPYPRLFVCLFVLDFWLVGVLLRPGLPNAFYCNGLNQDISFAGQELTSKYDIPHMSSK